MVGFSLDRNGEALAIQFWQKKFFKYFLIKKWGGYSFIYHQIKCPSLPVEFFKNRISKKKTISEKWNLIFLVA